jgi:hypothetical protein
MGGEARRTYLGEDCLQDLGEEEGRKTCQTAEQVQQKPVSRGVFSMNCGVLQTFPEQDQLLKGSSPPQRMLHGGLAMRG